MHRHSGSQKISRRWCLCCIFALFFVEVSRGDQAQLDDYVFDTIGTFVPSNHYLPELAMLSALASQDAYFETGSPGNLQRAGFHLDASGSFVGTETVNAKLDPFTQFTTPFFVAIDLQWRVSSAVIEGRRVINISFRGTEGDKLRDILTDAALVLAVPYAERPQYLVHSGFWASCQAAIREIMPVLIGDGEPTLRKSLSQVIADVANGRSDDIIWLTGHSLGGAIATLFACDLRRGDAQGGRHALPEDNVFAYSFGAPMLGIESFVREFENDLHFSLLSVRNEADPVPFLPPHPFYRQIGSVVTYKTPRNPEFLANVPGFSSGVIPLSFPQHSLVTYLRNLGWYLRSPIPVPYADFGEVIQRSSQTDYLAIKSDILKRGVTPLGATIKRVERIRNAIRTSADLFTAILDQDASAILEESGSLIVQARKYLAETKGGRQLIESVDAENKKFEYAVAFAAQLLKERPAIILDGGTIPDGAVLFPNGIPDFDKIFTETEHGVAMLVVLKEAMDQTAETRDFQEFLSRLREPEPMVSNQNGLTARVVFKEIRDATNIVLTRDPKRIVAKAIQISTDFLSARVLRHATNYAQAELLALEFLDHYHAAYHENLSEFLFDIGIDPLESSWQLADVFEKFLSHGRRRSQTSFINELSDRPIIFNEKDQALTFLRQVYRENGGLAFSIGWSSADAKVTGSASTWSLDMTPLLQRDYTVTTPPPRALVTSPFGVESLIDGPWFSFRWTEPGVHTIRHDVSTTGESIENFAIESEVRVYSEDATGVLLAPLSVTSPVITKMPDGTLVLTADLTLPVSLVVSAASGAPEPYDPALHLEVVVGTNPLLKNSKYSDNWRVIRFSAEGETQSIALAVPQTLGITQRVGTAVSLWTQIRVRPPSVGELLERADNLQISAGSVSFAFEADALPRYVLEIDGLTSTMFDDGVVSLQGGERLLLRLPASDDFIDNLLGDLEVIVIREGGNGRSEVIAASPSPDGSAILFSVPQAGNYRIVGFQERLPDGTIGQSQAMMAPQFSVAGGKRVLPGGIVQVAIGGSYSLFLDEAGDVWSCGRDSSGQLGHGFRSDRHSVPTKIAALDDVHIVQVSASGASFALDADGDVWSWGSNSFGRLGHGDSTDRDFPTKIAALDDIYVTKVECRSGHTFAIDSSGRLWAWGYNGGGGLGLGDLIDRSVPEQVVALDSYFVRSISTSPSANRTMALVSDANSLDSVWSWGMLGFAGSGLGINGPDPVMLPKRVSLWTTKVPDAISLGDNHSLVLLGDGTVLGSGYNSQGQIGNGTYTHSSGFQSSTDLLGIDVAKVVCGGGYSYVIDKDHDLWTWGGNGATLGPLGHGDTLNRLHPEKVAALDALDIVDAETRNDAGMALDEKGRVYVWGRNDYGQLGLGLAVNTFIYAPVLNSLIGPDNVTSVSITGSTLPDGSYVGGNGEKLISMVASGGLTGLRAVKKGDAETTNNDEGDVADIYIGDVPSGTAFTVRLPVNAPRTGGAVQTEHWELRDSNGAVVPIAQSSSNDFWWKVRTNRPPQFAISQRISATAREGETAQIQLRGEDPDGDPVTFSLVSGNGAMIVNNEFLELQSTEVNGIEIRRFDVALSDGVESITKSFSFVITDGGGTGGVYSDVLFDPGAHEFYDAIHWLTSRGIVHGSDDPSSPSGMRLFQPTKVASQAEVLAVLMASANDVGLIELRAFPEIPLPDLISDGNDGTFYDYSWLGQYLPAAFALGLVEDVMAFDPARGATREWTSKLIFRLAAARFAGDAITPHLPSFTDDAQFSSPAAAMKASILAFRAMMGVSGAAFEPLSNLKRQEMALIASRLYFEPEIDSLILAGAEGGSVIQGQSYAISGVSGFSLLRLSEFEGFVEGTTIVAADENTNLSVYFADGTLVKDFTPVSELAAAPILIPTNHLSQTEDTVQELVCYVRDGLNGVASEYRQRVYGEVPDRDGDGVRDEWDLWPDVAGFHTDANNNGIPDAADERFGLTNFRAGDRFYVNGLQLTALDAALIGGANDEYTGDFTTTASISRDGITTGNLTPNDVDFFRIEVAEGGRVRCRLVGSLGFFATLYSSDGQVVASVDGTEQDYAVIALKIDQAVLPGTYYLGVTAQHPDSVGSYKVVTSSNEMETLVVREFRMDGSDLVLTFEGDFGVFCRIQSSFNLVNWDDMAIQVFSDGGVQTLRFRPELEPSVKPIPRFFRVVGE